jgi:hypothetical protein
MSYLKCEDKKTPYIEVLYEEEFASDPIIIQPSTYFGQFVIDHKKLNVNFPLIKGQYYLVYGDSTSDMTEGAYVVPVLMDSDYPEDPFYSVFNARSEPLVLKKVSFIVYICSKTFLSNNLCETDSFKLPLIRQVERKGFDDSNFDSAEKLDEIVEFRKSSRHANGLDVVFGGRREYQIPANCELRVKISWTESFKQFFEGSSRLIMPRSSFARLGLTTQLLENGDLILKNNSHKSINLGERFVQLVLPMCFSFFITKDLVNRLAVNSVESPIESTLKNNPRKKKNIKNK